MRYMLAVFSLLLLVTTNLAQQQDQQLPNSLRFGTATTLPGSPQQPSSQMPPDQKAPPPRALPIAEVREKIQQHLNSEPTLKNTRLDVMTDAGAIVLIGTVDTEKQHNLALHIARSYSGDRKVVDKITLRQ